MAKKDSRRHHYTPVWLLKRFCGEGGLLWWRRQNWSLEKAERSSPKGQFFENDLNTRFLADGSKDLQVENELACVDGKIAGITKRLVEQCRQGHPPDLCEESRALLYWYMFVQFNRVSSTISASTSTPPWRSVWIARENPEPRLHCRRHAITNDDALE